MTAHTTGEAPEREAFEKWFFRQQCGSLGSPMYAMAMLAWLARGEYEHTRPNTPAPEAVEKILAHGVGKLLPER